MRWIPVLLVVGGEAMGAPGPAPVTTRSTVVIGAGECADPALSAAVSEVQTVARGLATPLMDAETVLRAVRSPATRSLPDIARQLEGAKALLYGGNVSRGLELVRDALTDLDRLAPQARAWPTTVTARILEAQMLRNLDRPREAAESFKRVLRLEPQHRLDPDQWPPSTVQAMDAARRELARTRKGSVSVTSTQPGATVFLDGKEVGKAPFRMELAPGDYALTLAAGEAASFPHRVIVQAGKEEQVRVDLAFEGSVAPRTPLCVSGSDDDAGALKLASAVAAQQVLVLRNSAPRAAPPYLTGVLYDVARGDRVRDGGVRPQQLGDLVLYLFTGKPDIAEQPALPPPPPPSLAGPSPGVPPGPPAATTTPGTPLAPARVSTSRGLSAARVVSLVVGGVGVALAGTGVGVLVAGAEDRERLSRLVDPVTGRLPLTPAEAEASRLLLDSTRTNQVLAWTLVGAGAGALTAGVVGFFLFPDSPAPVTLAPAPGGVTVSGRF